MCVSVESGPAMKAIWVPSGDHVAPYTRCTPPTSSATSTIRRSAVPSGWMAMIEPVCVSTNAISVPSGDHEGPSTFSGPSASMSVPPAFITYRRSGEGGFPPVARSYAIEAKQFGDSITRERALDLARLDRENFLTYEDLAMPPATGTVRDSAFSSLGVMTSTFNSCSAGHRLD